jgi:hypothetical protein
MRKTTLALVSIAAAASMVGIANAVPFGTNNLPPGLENQGGSPPGLGRQGGTGTPGGFNSQGGNNPLIALNASPNTPVSAVPEGGSSVILLGAGLFALALFSRRLQRSY